MWPLLLAPLAAADPLPCAHLVDDPACAVRPSLREAAEAEGLPWPPPGAWLLVDKSERRMTLWSGAVPVKAWRVALGGAPEGDKERRGDQRTPTGDLAIVARNDRSAFHLFLGLDYPGEEDVARGLRDGLIDEEDAALVRGTLRRGGMPAGSTALGGAIGIHGGGSSIDWTLGCVAVEDEEIEELWAATRLGTLVRIIE